MVCPMPPSSNRLYRYVGGHPIKSAVYKQYLREFAKEVLSLTPELLDIDDTFFDRDTPYEVEMQFNFDRILRKKKSNTTRFLMLDLDNRLKALCDAVKKFVGIDDANYMNYKLAKRSFPHDRNIVHVKIRRMGVEELEEWPW